MFINDKILSFKASERLEPNRTACTIQTSTDVCATVSSPPLLRMCHKLQPLFSRSPILLVHRGEVESPLLYHSSGLGKKWPSLPHHTRNLIPFHVSLAHCVRWTLLSLSFENGWATSQRTSERFGKQWVFLLCLTPKPGEWEFARWCMESQETLDLTQFNCFPRPSEAHPTRFGSCFYTFPSNCEVGGVSPDLGLCSHLLRAKEVQRGFVPCWHDREISLPFSGAEQGGWKQQSSPATDPAPNVWIPEDTVLVKSY